VSLPLRLFEFGAVYRHEKSGVVHGLTRVRGMTRDDARIFCTKEQMAGEPAPLLDFVLDLLRDPWPRRLYLELSTKPEAKAVGPTRSGRGDRSARAAAMTKNLGRARPGGGVSTGRRSVQAKDAIGRTWQMSTIQLDFQTPQRFGLECTRAPTISGNQPIMIHRALFGSIERFFGVLVEHYAVRSRRGSPVQAVVLPVSDRHDAHAPTVDRLKAEDSGPTSSTARPERSGRASAGRRPRRCRTSSWSATTTSSTERSA
jgi:threonyl-tRNA synthetase